MGCYLTRERKEASFGFLLNDSEEGLWKAGICSGLVIISEAGLGEAGINWGWMLF